MKTRLCTAIALMALSLPAFAQSSQGLPAVDRAFLDAMIPHHQLGVQLAEQATRKATHRELRRFAQQMVKDQQRDIESMRVWHRKWFSGPIPTPNPVPDLPKGHGFDIWWMRAMREHHQGAIDMARIGGPAFAHADLKRFANQTIDQQRKEQEKLSAWLKSWSK